MKRFLFFIASSVFLSACADPVETCSGYGFKPGTNEHANCQMQVSEQNRQRAANVAAASSNMGVMNKPFPQTTRTSCRQYGGSLNCTSQSY
jgi:hypothetical protein